MISLKRQSIKLLSCLLALTLVAGILPENALAAGMEYRYGTMEYYSKITEAYVADSYCYTDRWFLGDPADRNDSLALVSAQLSSAVADDPRYGVRFLEDLGFEAAAERFGSPEDDDCAYVLGTKTIQRNGTDCTLMAVAFQGMLYGEKGWRQNFTVNGTDAEQADHAAFTAAARAFFSDLALLPEKPDILWITGQSRGGAVANLAAAYSLTECPVVFGYTFEAPATTESIGAGAPQYAGIHNYICGDDPVPMLPMWGMTRYGQEIRYDSASMETVTAQVAAMNPAAASYIAAYRPDAFENGVSGTLEELIGRLTFTVPSRQAYTAQNTDSCTVFGRNATVQYTYQAGMQALSRIAFSGSSPVAWLPLLLESPAYTYSCLEERYALEHSPENREALLLDAASKRWTTAWTLRESLGGDAVSQEDLYALLKLLGPVLYDTGIAEKPDWKLPDFDLAFILSSPNYIDSTARLVFEHYQTLVFPHHSDVILSRLKLLAPGALLEDVPAGAYYADAVRWAAEQGVTQGYDATRFAPEDPCTRGQMVTFLWRAAGQPEPEGLLVTFSDVEKGAYYAKAVQWAAEQGIAKGTGGNRFSPNAPVDRGQCVTFLYRMLGEGTDQPNPFSDVPPNAFYADAVRWAAASGVTTGKTRATFDPAGVCTRGQIVTFLYRAINQD